jgi:hypothetical protein
LKDAEILQNRLETLDRVSQYVGEYFSKEYIWKHVLMLSEEEAEEMLKQITTEAEAETTDDDNEDGDFQ